MGFDWIHGIALSDCHDVELEMPSLANTANRDLTSRSLRLQTLTLASIGAYSLTSVRGAVQLSTMNILRPAILPSPCFGKWLHNSIPETKHLHHQYQYQHRHQHYYLVLCWILFGGRPTRTAKRAGSPRLKRGTNTNLPFRVTNIYMRHVLYEVDGKWNTCHGIIERNWTWHLSVASLSAS